MCMYVSEICAEGIFITFLWWLKNVKSRSKIVLFSNERHFEIWFPKKKTITFFWSKLSKLHKKEPILHVATTFFLKQGETRTSHGPIPHPLMTSSLSLLFCGGFSPFTNTMLRSSPSPSLPLDFHLDCIQPLLCCGGFSPFTNTMLKASPEYPSLFSPPFPSLPLDLNLDCIQPLLCCGGFSPYTNTMLKASPKYSSLFSTPSLPSPWILTLIASNLCCVVEVSHHTQTLCWKLHPSTPPCFLPLPFPTPGFSPWLHPTFVVLWRFLTIHKHCVESFTWVPLCSLQGLRASSLQFTSPLEFNAIFRDSFPLRLDLNGWSKIRDPVTAKFKHLTIIVICTLLRCDDVTYVPALQNFQKADLKPYPYGKKYTTFSFPIHGALASNICLRDAPTCSCIQLYT